MSVKTWPKWYKFVDGSGVAERINPTRFIIHHIKNGYQNLGECAWEAEEYRDVETGKLIPITADEAERLLHPENHEWVTLDPEKYWNHIPRVGVDWFGDHRSDNWTLQQNGHTRQSVGSYFHITRGLHRCLRKDLPPECPRVPEPVKPATRTVTLYEFIGWDAGGDEELCWSSGPPVETDTKYGFNHYFKTGNTRTIEVPV